MLQIFRDHHAHSVTKADFSQQIVKRSQLHAVQLALKECSLKYNTFTEMNFNRFDFSDGNEIVGSMFAKCEMQLANFKGVELHETEFYQCDLRKADFRDATGYKVDILGSRLKDAKFSLPEAVNLLADLKIKLS